MSARTAVVWVREESSVWRLDVPAGAVGHAGESDLIYWVSPAGVGCWYVEDNCGACWGGYESALDARSAVERTIGL